MNYYKKLAVSVASILLIVSVSLAAKGDKASPSRTKLDATRKASTAQTDLRSAERNVIKPDADNVGSTSADVTEPDASRQIAPIGEVDVNVAKSEEPPLVEPESIEAPNQNASNAAANYAIPWQSVNGGGGPSTSTNYQVNASVGQSTIGFATSTNYQAGIGYWYGAGADFSTVCACDCHGDPANCPGVVDVFDVVAAVDEAFRNGPPVVDPNPNCPYTDNNVNCDAIVDVFDVVAMVEVAFRNGDPNVVFCDPCS